MEIWSGLIASGNEKFNRFSCGNGGWESGKGQSPRSFDSQVCKGTQILIFQKRYQPLSCRGGWEDTPSWFKHVPVLLVNICSHSSKCLPSRKSCCAFAWSQTHAKCLQNESYRAACFAHGSKEIAKPEYKCKLIPTAAWGNSAATPQYKGVMLRPPGRTRSALPHS